MLEPGAGSGDTVGPEHEALVADSVGPALLAILETLTSAERVAFVLHDVFGVPFAEIAPVGALLERDQDAREPGAAAGTGRRRRSRSRPQAVDGAAGPAWAPGGRPRVAFGFEVAGGKIVGIEVIADPERLGRLDVTVLDG